MVLLSLLSFCFVVFNVFLPLGCSFYPSATQRRGGSRVPGRRSLLHLRACSSLSCLSPLGDGTRATAARITGPPGRRAPVPGPPACEVPAYGRVRGGGGASRAAFPACPAACGGRGSCFEGPGDSARDPRPGRAVAGAWRWLRGSVAESAAASGR